MTAATWHPHRTWLLLRLSESQIVTCPHPHPCTQPFARQALVSAMHLPLSHSTRRAQPHALPADLMRGFSGAAGQVLGRGLGSGVDAGDTSINSMTASFGMQ